MSLIYGRPGGERIVVEPGREARGALLRGLAGVSAGSALSSGAGLGLSGTPVMVTSKVGVDSLPAGLQRAPLVVA
jgi:hypothetical protein